MSDKDKKQFKLWKAMLHFSSKAKGKKDYFVTHEERILHTMTKYKLIKKP